MYMSILEQMESRICVREVSKLYGENKALDRISMTAEQGKITGLIGPDGAGKSTLMKIILSLESRDSGTVSCLGFDPGTERNRIRNKIGYMPEVFSLYLDQSVEENMIFFFGIHGGLKKDYPERRDRLYRFNRLEPFAGTRAGNLSGGMKQKLALSCALMHDPELLVLDEPTTGVDPLSRREFWNMLKELKSQGISILVSTPYMDEAILCDSIYMMDKGRVLEQGDPRVLTEKKEGFLYEISVKGKRPQEYLERTEDLFPDDPVYLSGRFLHLFLDEPLPSDKLFSLGNDVVCRNIGISLEDLFMVRLLKEGKND